MNNTTAVLSLVNDTGHDRNLAERVVGSLTLCFIILMTVLGNIFVIIAIFHHRPLRKVQNFFLISLAFADLLVGVTVMPFHVVKFISNRWVFGRLMCRLWITFDILLCTSSICNLCAIALDRYWAIHSPLKYANRRTGWFVLSMTGAAWIMGAMISLPPLLGWNDWNQESLVHRCEYTTQKGFVIYSACGSFYFPLLVMSIVYVKIFVTARSRLQQRKREGSKVALTKNGTITGGKTKKEKAEFANTRRLLAMKPGKNPDGSAREGSVPNSDDPSPNPDETPRGSMQGGRNSIFAAGMTSLLRRGTLFEEDNDPEFKSLKNFFNQKEKISVAKERRAAKTLAIIMGVFVLCWLPFFTMYLIQPFCDRCIHEKIYEAANWLGYINSSLNPIIYTIFNLDFRKAFKQLIWKTVSLNRNSNS